MLRPKNKKFKVAIISLTSCDGCQVALLDLGQRFLELFKKIDLSQEELFISSRLKKTKKHEP